MRRTFYKHWGAKAEYPISFNLPFLYLKHILNISFSGKIFVLIIPGSLPIQNARHVEFYYPAQIWPWLLNMDDREIDQWECVVGSVSFVRLVWNLTIEQRWEFVTQADLLSRFIRLDFVLSQRFTERGVFERFWSLYFKGWMNLLIQVTSTMRRCLSTSRKTQEI